MDLITLLTLSINIFSVYCVPNLKKYYEQLISQGIQDSLNYKYPKDASQYRPTNSKPKYYGFYDFVIVGAGSAGSVVASRLSEINKWKVLLLEAGKEENNFTRIPSMSSFVQSSEYDWGYNSTKSSTCCLAKDGICRFKQGKSLGGSCATNYLIYDRGNPNNYKNWLLQGNPDWSYTDVLPFFKKIEKSHLPNNEPGMQGLNGYLDIYYHTPLSEKVHIFLNASKELGYRNVNVLGKDEIGSSPTPFSIRWGRRLSSAEAYLSPAKTRKNLTVRPRSFVTKIFLSIKFKKAIGVQFSVNNTLYSVQAGKEVVLTAGVVGTPKLLMLSGIGKEEQLKKVKIKVKQNLQVGTKLRNHFYLRNISYVTSISEPFFTLSDSIKQYLSTVGPLTISDNKQGLLLTKLAQSEGDVPEVEITFSPSSNSLGFDSEQPNPKNDIFHFALKLLNTSTEGNITLRSNDPFDYPIKMILVWLIQTMKILPKLMKVFD